MPAPAKVSVTSSIAASITLDVLESVLVAFCIILAVSVPDPEAVDVETMVAADAKVPVSDSVVAESRRYA